MSLGGVPVIPNDDSLSASVENLFIYLQSSTPVKCMSPRFSWPFSFGKFHERGNLPKKKKEGREEREEEREREREEQKGK